MQAEFFIASATIQQSPLFTRDDANQKFKIRTVQIFMILMVQLPVQ